LLANNAHWDKVQEGGEKVVVSFSGIKRNRGLKLDERGIVITDKAVYLVTEKPIKPKTRIPFENIVGVELSQLNDGVFVVQTKNEKKGDLCLIEPSGKRAIEIATRLYRYVEAATKTKIKVTIAATYALHFFFN